MIRLYKTIHKELHYWETLDKDESTSLIHWGKVGQSGHNKELKSESSSDFSKTMQTEIDKKIHEGYAEIDDLDHSFLEVEFEIGGLGTDKDLDKRHKLEKKIDEILGWTGLGYCEGGSIGTGTMEVSCNVVDYEIAKKVIEDTLRDSEYAAYSRIYTMDDD